MGGKRREAMAFGLVGNCHDCYFGFFVLALIVVDR